jgi:hypothetical protein
VGAVLTIDSRRTIGGLFDILDKEAIFMVFFNLSTSGGDKTCGLRSRHYVEFARKYDGEINYCSNFRKKAASFHFLALHE